MAGFRFLPRKRRPGRQGSGLGPVWAAAVSAALARARRRPGPARATTMTTVADPHLAGALQPWRHRLRLAHALATAARAAVVAPGVALPWLLLDRFSLERTWLVVAGVSAAAALLVLVCVAVRRAPGWREAARAADRVAGLAEQAVTALAPLPGTPPAFQALQRQRALEALAGADPRQLPLAPRGWRRLAAVAAVAVVLDAALLLWPNPLTPVRAEREHFRRAVVQAQAQLDALRRSLEQGAAEGGPAENPAAEPRRRELERALDELDRRLEAARRNPTRETLAAAAEAARRARDLAAVTQAGNPAGTGGRENGGSRATSRAETAALARDLSQQLRAASDRVARGERLSPQERQSLAQAASRLAARLGNPAGGAGGEGGQDSAAGAGLAGDLTRLAGSLAAGSSPSAAELAVLADRTASLASRFGSAPGAGSGQLAALPQLSPEDLAAIADSLAAATASAPASVADAGPGNAGHGSAGDGGGRGNGASSAGEGADTGVGAGSGGAGSGSGPGGGSGDGGGSGASSGGGSGGSGWGTGTAGSPLAGGLGPLPGARGQVYRLPGSNAPGSLALPGWTQEPIVVRPGTTAPASGLRAEFAAQAALDLGEEPLPEELERLVEAYFSAGPGR